MHPWLKVFTAYVEKQLPDVTDTPKHSIVLIQRFCDRYHVRTISEACDILSRYQMVTLQELRDRNESIVNNISSTCSSSSRIQEGSHQFILVAKFATPWKTGPSDITCYIQDSSSSLYFSSSVQSIQLELKHFKVPTLFTKWNFIPVQPAVVGSCSKNSLNHETTNETSSSIAYMEIEEVLMQETERLHYNKEFLKVSEFLAKFHDQKLNNITGVVISKSPVHKSSGHNPFFFIWLQSMTSKSSATSDMVALTVQGTAFMAWHLIMQLYDYIEITDVKRNIWKKGSTDERKVFCNSKTSQLDIVHHHTAACTSVKSNFGADLETYTGLITSTQLAKFGVYVLDKKVKLVLSQSHLTQGRGFRCGALVRAANVHRHEINTGIVLCCCTLSTVDVIAHSNFSMSPFEPFLLHYNPINSKFENYSPKEYLWIVETSSNILKSFAGKFPESTVFNAVCDQLLRFVHSSARKRNLVKEFLDLPHRCIFTVNTAKSTPSIRTISTAALPEQVTISQLRDSSVPIMISQEWFNGLEFDFFTSLKHCQRKNWYYCSVDANNARKEGKNYVTDFETRKNFPALLSQCRNKKKNIIVGVAIGNKTTFTLRDSTDSIHVISPFLEEPLNRRMIMIKNFEIIAERYTYTELLESTGQGEEKEFTKLYLLVKEKEDLCILYDQNTSTITKASTTTTAVATATTSTATSTVVGRREEINEKTAEPLYKKIKLDEDDVVCMLQNQPIATSAGESRCVESRYVTLTGYVVSREFKRNSNCVYDVEMRSNGKIFVPKHGRIDASELIKTNTSLYPLTTSVLVIRLQDENSPEKKVVQIYLDSNILRYPCLLFPGARVNIRGVRPFVNQSGTVYYKIGEDSAIEILRLPSFVFTELKELMDTVKNAREISAVKRDLTSFLYEKYVEQKNNSNTENPSTTKICKNVCGGEFTIVARMTFVQSIIVHWTCGVCFMEIQDGGCCKMKCRNRDQKRFCATVRCVVDDGTAECYLNLENNIALKLLALSAAETDLLHAATLKNGKITYHRKSGSDYIATELSLQASKRRQSEYLLYQKTLNPICQSYYSFYCKKFKTDQQLEFPMTSISNGITQFHSATHPKLWFQCMDFKSVDYVKMAREHLSGL